MLHSGDFFIALKDGRTTMSKLENKIWMLAARLVSLKGSSGMGVQGIYFIRWNGGYYFLLQVVAIFIYFV